MPEGPLGRREPTDWRHVERYPLRALAAPDQPKRTPVEVGFTWWPEYDDPTKGRDGRWRVKPTAGRRPRGGHAFCFRPRGVEHPVSWWTFYDQSAPGAAVDPSGCVGFSLSQYQSLNNRHRYSGGWLYLETKRNDEWSGEDYEGTSVRAGFERLRTVGHRRIYGGRERPEALSEGIDTYRWLASGDETATVLGYPGADEIPFTNTWGRDGYPHIVWMPVSEFDRHLNEWGGEAGVATDR